MLGRKDSFPVVEFSLGFCSAISRPWVRFMTVSCLTVCVAGCADDAVQTIGSDVQLEWSDYNPQPPSPELEKLLSATVARYPEKRCVPVPTDVSGIDASNIEISENGQEQICIWEHPAGVVPDGSSYADVASCENVRTLGPSWYIPPSRKVETDPSLLADETYRTELEWVRQQVAASGCSCCHASQQSGYASFFDIDAPGIWTDTLTMTAVAMGAGLADEHKYLGYLPSDDNFGFDREITIFATTDIPRMKAFFMEEFERRGGTDADVKLASDTFRQINSSLFEEASTCGPGEGMDANGRLVWKGGEARQVYIQEVGSQNPGSPPNLDRPEGTIWALYAGTEELGFESGTVAPGVVPAGALQRTPFDGTEAPVFEDGKTYRLFVTPDLLLGNIANCEFTFGEASDLTQQECGDDNTVCTELLFPEGVQEQPEKLVVALYKSLPPLGPPDVFPPTMVDTPDIPFGDSMEVLIDAPVTGEYFVYAVLYMPGGGATSWQPVPGVDFVATSGPLTLDGRGIYLDSALEMALKE